MPSRPRDRQVRCPYCNRHLARDKGGYLPQKFCPHCGASLPSDRAPRFDAMMRGAKYTAAAFGGRACPLEVFALIAMTAALLS